MKFIRDIVTWGEIPANPPDISFEEMDGLLREMKPLLAYVVCRYPKYWTEKWYIPSIWKLGYEYRLGEWFLDSLIQVNQILRQEEETGVPRTIVHNVGPYPGAAQLARVYGDCYRYPDGNYAWRLCVSFWKDGAREFEEKGYDVTEMMEHWWPCIVKSFGLLPSIYEAEKENTDF